MKNITKKLIIFSMIFSMIVTNALAFTDTDGHWASEYINRMHAAGYIDGYTDGSFMPNRTITRAEFSKIICKVFDLPELSYSDFLNYQDISEGDWYSPYIASADVFMPGYTDGLFRPNDKLSRIDAGYTLLNLYGITVKDTDVAKTMLDYEEFKYDTVTTKIVSTLLENGIMKGKDNGFKPYDTLTRAELCTLIMRTVTEKGFKFSFEEYLDQILSHYLPDENDASTIETEVLNIINQRRAENGAGPLELDESLTQVAYAHSLDMVERNFFNHSNPDGLSPFDRMKNYGIEYSSAAENIAAGQQTPEDVMEAWMNSPGHRKNILNPAYNKIGIGVAKGGFYGIYWTTCFIAD